MRVPHQSLTVLSCAIGALALAAGLGRGQPTAPADDTLLNPKALMQQVMVDLVQAWAEIAQQVSQDPMFLESPEAQPLFRRAESLQMVLHQMAAALRPEGPDPGPEENGRFQFVEWQDPATSYWVLDTRTGDLHLRDAPL